MPFKEAKVYNDGSHYIAIPQTKKPTKQRVRSHSEAVIIVELPSAKDDAISVPLVDKGTQLSFVFDDVNNSIDYKLEKNSDKVKPQKQENLAPIITKKMTKKELFNTLYAEHSHLSKSKRKSTIISAMRPYFQTDDAVDEYVCEQLLRKQRNLITRRIRCVRKMNLQEFNYFVTFTYDGKLHTENTFSKKLKSCLSRYRSRKDWKYIGVWERSPTKKRLHFHGIFYIPDGTMPGFMIQKTDYNTTTKKQQVTNQNTYFNDNFGRSSFEPIENQNGLLDAISYIFKYLEKSGERIVYSRGLPQYFISDILDDDIVCRIGLEDKKLLLFDNFTCLDEGLVMGSVSKEVIQQMPKSN